MAKTVKFKNPAGITFGGQHIGPHNITPELYEMMIEKAPSLKDHFDLVEETHGKKKDLPDEEQVKEPPKK